MTDSTETDSKKTSKPQLVKLDRAFKLAEQWVGTMSKSKSKENAKSVEVELEGRPARLGIGATAPKETNNIAHFSNALERKIMAKLQGDKRRAEREAQDLEPSAKNGNVDEDDSDDELESKTKSFTKKRPPLALNSPKHGKRKRR